MIDPVTSVDRVYSCAYPFLCRGIDHLFGLIQAYVHHSCEIFCSYFGMPVFGSDFADGAGLLVRGYFFWAYSHGRHESLVHEVGHEVAGNGA